MAFFKEELTKIRGFVFDVDGVLSRATQEISEDGVPKRTTNLKDGYAIYNAIQCGYKIAIITGGVSDAVYNRYSALGIDHIYMGAGDKLINFADWLEKSELSSSEVMYMGDDLPDIAVMLKVLLPVCPEDAAPEVKAVSKYISPIKGGEGCVRDVMEQVLKAAGCWADSQGKWSSF